MSLKDQTAVRVLEYPARAPSRPAKRGLAWLEKPVIALVRAVVLRRRRQAAIIELAQLDDNHLRDLGLDRGQIPEFVDSLIANGDGRLLDRVSAPTESHLGA